MTYQSYHTDIKIRYQLGLLQTEIKNQIPNSTLNSWNSANLTRLFGANHLITDEKIEVMKTFIAQKRLYQIAKAITSICLVYQQILGKTGKWQTQITGAKQLILQAIAKTKETLGLKRACRVFGISYQQYNNWQSAQTPCRESFLQFCNKRWPSQLTFSEVGLIKNYLLNEAYRHWSLKSVYYQVMRERRGFFSLGTFYKYAKALGIQRRLPNNRKKKHDIGIRAEKPFQIIHADVTIFRPLDNTKIYLYFIVDNFSRSILGWKASLELSAEIFLENLREVCEKYHLNDTKTAVTLLTDGGPENTANSVKAFLENPQFSINHLVAQTDIFLSNSMSESANKHMKYYYLFREPLANFEQTVEYLETKAIPDFANKPHSLSRIFGGRALFGFTPHEVLIGALPYNNRFKASIHVARTQRIAQNLLTKCEICPK